MNKENPFKDKTLIPDKIILKKEFGKTFSHYEELMALVSSYQSEWNYSDKSGWMQKIFDKKKALFYIMPRIKFFIISLTVRENEKELLLKDKELKDIYPLLKTAKKFSEGYAMQISIEDYKSHAIVLTLVARIMRLRY